MKSNSSIYKVEPDGFLVQYVQMNSTTIIKADRPTGKSFSRKQIRSIQNQEIV